MLEDSLNLNIKELLKKMQERSFQNHYFGIGSIKCPLDFWVYREIIWETKPDVIIEIGNYNGGTLLALAHICDNLNKGRVIGVDVNHNIIPFIVRQHKRISLITGYACEQFIEVNSRIKENERVLVIEDSAHTYTNTLNVLKLYSTLIKKGDYIIVEDSICRHGLDIGPKPGPYEAIEDFIKESKDFEIDRNREEFLITWNPKGYLKKIR